MSNRQRFLDKVRELKQDLETEVKKDCYDDKYNKGYEFFHSFVLEFCRASATSGGM